MTKRNKTKAKTSRDAKKAIIMKNDKRSNVPTIMGVAAIILIAAGLIFYSAMGIGENNGPVAKSAAQKMDGFVTYAASDFNNGKAHHYLYADKTLGLTIKYFILKSTDGVIRSAFDACDVCWPAGKGYYQEGTHMVCKNCGRRFESVNINVVKGGCNPAPLNHTLKNDTVIINVDDIKKGKSYFDFSKRA